MRLSTSEGSLAVSEAAAAAEAVSEGKEKGTSEERMGIAVLDDPIELTEPTELNGMEYALLLLAADESESEAEEEK